MEPKPEAIMATVKAARKYADCPDVRTLHELKRCIANQTDPSGPGESASASARRLVADAQNRRGTIHVPSLTHAISGLYVALYKAQGRLPLFRNVETGEVYE